MPETAAAIGTYFTAAEGTAAVGTAATAGTAAAGTAAATGTAATAATAATAGIAETGALGYGLGGLAGTATSGYVLPASVAAAGAGAGVAAGTGATGGLWDSAGKAGAQAAASAAVSSALSPKKPDLPKPLAMPDPVAAEEARKKSIVEQMARRGRASTILTDASGSLGG